MVVSGPGKEVDGVIKGEAIPYQLADTGNYDVWLWNARGNYYSREHLWLDPDSDTQFWEFSF